MPEDSAGVAQGKPKDERESELAREILDNRFVTKAEGRKGQNPFLNALVVILIVMGVAALGLLYLFYLQSSAYQRTSGSQMNVSGFSDDYNRFGIPLPLAGLAESYSDGTGSYDVQVFAFRSASDSQKAWQTLEGVLSGGYSNSYRLSRTTIGGSAVSYVRPVTWKDVAASEPGRSVSLPYHEATYLFISGDKIVSVKHRFSADCTDCSQALRDGQEKGAAFVAWYLKKAQILIIG